MNYDIITLHRKSLLSAVFQYITLCKKYGRVWLEKIKSGDIIDYVITYWRPNYEIN